MTNTRKRLPEEVFWQVFAFVLQVAVEHKLLKGKTIAVDSTTLEANAAMKSLVRRDTNEDWKTYRAAVDEGRRDRGSERRGGAALRSQAEEEDVEQGVEVGDGSGQPRDEDEGRANAPGLQGRARGRSGQRADRGAVVYRGDDSDSETLPVTVEMAREQLQAAGSPHQVEEVVDDKGYHKAETIQTLEEVQQVRPTSPSRSTTGAGSGRTSPGAAGGGVREPASHQRQRGRQLGRWRSERAERTFAHTCETGGGRRAWLRGVVNVSKRTLRASPLTISASSCSRCSELGHHEPCREGLEALQGLLIALQDDRLRLSYAVLVGPSRRSLRSCASGEAYSPRNTLPLPAISRSAAFSTGC